MHTYGMVIGFSSPNIQIKKIEKKLEVKLPIKIAIALSVVSECMNPKSVAYSGFIVISSSGIPNPSKAL